MLSSDDHHHPAAMPQSLPRRRNTAKKQAEVGEHPLSSSTPQKEKRPKKKTRDFEINCPCHQPHDGRDILRCKYMNCLTKFFHADCVGHPLNYITWSCDACAIQHGRPVDRNTAIPHGSNNAMPHDSAPPAEEQKKKNQPWLSPDDIDKIFALRTTTAPPRGPGGDIYGLDSWRDGYAATQHEVQSHTPLNAIGRIMEQVEREKDLVAVTTWRADVRDFGGEVEWEYEWIEDWDEEEEEEEEAGEECDGVVEEDPDHDEDADMDI